MTVATGGEDLSGAAVNREVHGRGRAGAKECRMLLTGIAE